MDTQQIDLVKQSLKKIVPIAELVATMFYKKLFELDPSLQLLFKGDMKEQGRKLMLMIATAVNGLDDLDTIVPAAQALGVRHAGYGVKDKHYDTVGAALLWTLDSGLGEAFTPALKQAWTQTYVLLSGVMKESGRLAVETLARQRAEQVPLQAAR